MNNDVEELSPSEPDHIWLSHLAAAASTENGAASGGSTSKLIVAILTKLEWENTHHQSKEEFNRRAKLVMELLTVLRIALRWREEMTERVLTDLLLQLLNICCPVESELSSQARAVLLPAAAVRVEAVRCLINILFDNEARVLLFSAEPSPHSGEGIDGLNRIASSLISLSTGASVADVEKKVVPEDTEEELLNLRFYFVRLVYMMLSQSSSLQRRHLHPQATTTIHVCVSLLHCFRLSTTGTIPSSCSAGTASFSTASDDGLVALKKKLFCETGKLLFALSVHEVLLHHHGRRTEIHRSSSYQSEDGTTDPSTTITATNSSNSSSMSKEDIDELYYILDSSIICTIMSFATSSSRNSSYVDEYASSRNDCTSTITSADAKEAAPASTSIVSATELITNTSSMKDTSNIGNTRSAVKCAAMDDRVEVALQLSMYLYDTYSANKRFWATNSLMQSEINAVVGDSSTAAETGDTAACKSDAKEDREVLVDTVLRLGARSADPAVRGNDGSVDTCSGSVDAKEQRASNNMIMQQSQQLLIDTLVSVILQGRLLHLEDQPGSSGSSTRISSAEQAAILTPCLVTMSNFISHSAAAKLVIKTLIFPNPPPPLQQAPPVLATAAAAAATGGGAATGIDPTDAPKDSLRGRLISHMISLDSQLKRCTAELIFSLCDEDPGEFTARTGFGNAVALLQIKGLC